MTILKIFEFEKEIIRYNQYSKIVLYLLPCAVSPDIVRNQNNSVYPHSITTPNKLHPPNIQQDFIENTIELKLRQHSQLVNYMFCVTYPHECKQK